MFDVLILTLTGTIVLSRSLINVTTCYSSGISERMAIAPLKIIIFTLICTIERIGSGRLELPGHLDLIPDAQLERLPALVVEAPTDLAAEAVADHNEELVVAQAAVV